MGIFKFASRSISLFFLHMRFVQFDKAAHRSYPNGKQMIVDDQVTAAVNLHDDEFFRLATECTVEAWLSFLGHRWSALILFHLSQGPKRFGELASSLPTVTAKMMSERLLSLQRRTLVERVGPHRDAAYRLTPRAKALMPILDALEVWARPA